jgi:type II secretory pathway predicted ATPase ExeA
MISIKKKELYDLYMLKVDEICEVCDWKTQFGPEEIVNIIANIIENNPQIIINNDLIALQSQLIALQAQLDRAQDRLIDR